jgi:hypothetical protein
MLQARLGEQATVTSTKSRYYQLLSLKQQWLANEYDWPFLEDRFDLAVPSGSRYLSFPTIDNEGVTSAMNLERQFTVEVFWNNVWSELDYGIGSEQFNYLNSDQPGQIQDPIQNWRWSEEGQIEIWPINSTAQKIRFTGQRALDVLVNDTDTADLDDQLIMLFVAADMLTRSKAADAQSTMNQATERLRACRGGYPTKTKKVSFCGDGGKNNIDNRRRLVPIAVAGR